MGFFDRLQRPGLVSPEPQKKPQIRKVVQKRPIPAGQNEQPRARRGNRWKRPIPEVRLTRDDGGEQDDGFSSHAKFRIIKRTRMDEGTEIDPKRQIRSVAALSEGGTDEVPPFIHAAQVTYPPESGEYTRSFEGTEESVEAP